MYAGVIHNRLGQVGPTEINAFAHLGLPVIVREPEARIPGIDARSVGSHAQIKRAEQLRRFNVRGRFRIRHAAIIWMRSSISHTGA